MPNIQEKSLFKHEENVLMKTAPAYSNLLSRNFVSVIREESQYLQARRIGLQAVAQQTNRQRSILNTALAQLALAGTGEELTYAERALIGQKAARRMEEEKQRSVGELSAQTLKEIKAELTNRTERAIESKDENSPPIQQKTTAASENAIVFQAHPDFEPRAVAASGKTVASSDASPPVSKSAAPTNSATPTINITV